MKYVYAQYLNNMHSYYFSLWQGEISLNGHCCASSADLACLVYSDLIMVSKVWQKYTPMVI